MALFLLGARSEVWSYRKQDDHNWNWQLMFLPRSIMIERLIPQIGFGWTMRACAFLFLGLLLIGNLTVVSRLKPKPTPFVVKEFLIPFKEPPFQMLALGSFFFFWGVFLPTNFIILEAEHYGMSVGLAGYLLAILNATRYVSRTAARRSNLTANHHLQRLRTYSSRLARRPSGALQRDDRDHLYDHHLCTRALDPRDLKRTYYSIRGGLRLHKWYLRQHDPRACRTDHERYAHDWRA